MALPDRFVSRVRKGEWVGLSSKTENFSIYLFFFRHVWRDVCLRIECSSRSELGRKVIQTTTNMRLKDKRIWVVPVLVCFLGLLPKQVKAQYGIYFKKGPSNITYYNPANCRPGSSTLSNELTIMEPSTASNYGQVMDKLYLTSCTPTYDYQGISIPSYAQVGGNLYNDNGMALSTHSSAPAGFSWKAKSQEGMTGYSREGFQTINYNTDPERITNFTFKVDMIGASFEYGLQMVVVPLNKLAPTIVTQGVTDPLNIAQTTVTLRAPEFIAKNFAPSEIQWFHYSYTEPIMVNNKPVTGPELTINWNNGTGDSLKYCVAMPYCARVMRPGWEGWISRNIDIKFSPNLRVGTDVVIQPPQCVLSQNNGDDSKSYGSLTMGSSVGNRRFVYTTKNEASTDMVAGSTREIVPDTGVMKFTFYEKFANDSKSCPQVISQRINKPKPLRILSGDLSDIVCFGKKASYTIKVSSNTLKDTVILDNQTKFAIDSGKAAILPDISKGKHTFRIKDQNNCQLEAEQTFTAVEPPQLLGVVSVVHPLCSTSKGTARLSATGGAGAYTYRFSKDSSYKPINAISGWAGTLLQPSVSDTKGCTADLKDTTWRMPADYSASAKSSKDNKCYNDTLGEALVTVRGNGRYQYSIDSVHFQTSPLVKGLVTGANTLYVRNDSNCVRKTEVSISSWPRIKVDPLIQKDVVCHGDSTGSLYLQVSGGKGKKKLSGEGLPSYSNPASAYNYTIDSLPSRTYLLVATDDSNCTQRLSFEIKAKSNITVAKQLTNPSCASSSNGAIAVNVTKGVKPYAYQWEGLTSTRSNLTGLGQGVFVLTVTDSLACSKKDTIRLVAAKQLPIKMDGYPYLCKGQTLTIDPGLNAATYRWTKEGILLSNTRKLIVDTSGVYKIVVTDSSGCSGTDSLQVYYSNVSFRPDYFMTSKAVVGERVVLVVGNSGYDQLWWSDTIPHMISVDTTQEKTKEYIFTQAGDYEVPLRMKMGQCMGTVKRKIQIFPASEKQEVEESLGIKAKLINEVSVAPNPTNGSFTLHVELNYKNDATITMFALSTGTQLANRVVSGQTVYEELFEEALPPGLYMLYVKVGSETASYRVLVTN